MITSLSALEDCGPQSPDSGAKDQPAITALQQAARPLQTEQELNNLLAAIGNSRYVLTGEASHETAEFTNGEQL